MGFVKRNLAVFGALLALVVVTMVTLSQVNGHAAALASGQTQLTDLQNQVAIANANNTKNAQSTTRQVTGVDADHKALDDSKITDLMKTAMTWKDYPSYVDARELVMKRYKLDPNSSFMKQFLPPVSNVKQGNGTDYNDIDAKGLNMSFDSITTTVTSLSAGKYNYLAVVTGHVTSKDQQSTSPTYALVTYTVDANNNLTNVEARSVPEAPSQLK